MYRYLRAQTKLRETVTKMLSSAKSPISTSANMLKVSTVDPQEMENFAHWKNAWHPDGPLGALMTFNEVRVPYIRDSIIKDSNLSAVSRTKPLESVRILDIGCGAGILSEPLARLGANVVGVDPCKALLDQAVAHMQGDPALFGKLEYHCAALKEYVETSPAKFDAVVASEVLDHVLNVDFFIEQCCGLTRPGGSLIVTTINQTLKAWLFMVARLEYIHRVLPKNTHKWSKLVSPESIAAIFQSNNCDVVDLRGYRRRVSDKKWYPVNNNDIYYTLRSVKKLT